MARVRYPFIVRYVKRYEDKAKFGKELPDGDYEQVEDQLEATVYTSLKMFKAGFEESPTEFIKRVNTYEHRNSDIDLIYVGV